MQPLFWFKCSASTAKRLGAKHKVPVPTNHLSFPCYRPVTTMHAKILTEEGWFCWPLTLDALDGGKMRFGYGE